MKTTKFLVRRPVKWFKWVSKSWRSLISSSMFTESHSPMKTEPGVEKETNKEMPNLEETITTMPKFTHSQMKTKHGVEETTMPKSLPEEMILEILVRLPAQSLIRFRCVSKSWRSLISSSEFSHLFSMRNRVLLINFDYSLRTVNYKSPNKPITTELYHPPLTAELLGSRQLVKVLGSCNGLVCILCSFDFGQCVFLYNPSTGHYRSIALPSPPSKSWANKCWGFGFVSDVQEYRLVRQVSDPFHVDKFEVQVLHLLETDEATIGSEISCNYSVLCRKIGISLNGSIHWLDVERCKIVRFDLAREVFGEMPVPNHRDVSLRWYNSLGVLDGCLSVLQSNVHSNNVWAMKEYGVKSSWTVLISIPRYKGSEYLYFMMPVTFLSDTKVLLVTRGYKGNIMIFDSVERSFKPICNVGFLEFSIYMGSSVSP